MLSKAEHGKGRSQLEEVKVGSDGPIRERGKKDSRPRGKQASCTQRGRKQRGVGGLEAEGGERERRGQMKQENLADS